VEKILDIFLKGISGEINERYFIIKK